MFNDVGQWLDTLGLGRYADNFAEHEVGLDLLPELGDADLKEMGISALGHRKTLLKSIAESNGFHLSRRALDAALASVP